MRSLARMSSFMKSIKTKASNLLHHDDDHHHRHVKSVEDLDEYIKIDVVSSPAPISYANVDEIFHSDGTKSSPPISYANVDEIFHLDGAKSSPPISYANVDEILHSDGAKSSPPISYANVDEIFHSDGAKSSPPIFYANVDEIFHSDGAKSSPLREWHSQNEWRIEMEARAEKQKRKEILLEAEKFKEAFYERRRRGLEVYKTRNRLKEKKFLDEQEEFHEDAKSNYWGAIGELIPSEDADDDGDENAEEIRDAGIVIAKGQKKPGKPTDLSRMRQILHKLEKAPPPHLLRPQHALSTDAKDEIDTMTDSGDDSSSVGTPDT